MNSSRAFVTAYAFAAIALACTTSVHAQAPWRVDSRGASGPVAQVALPDAGIKRRTAFIVFEYARQCDPIFSFAEITGSRPKYDNGYEAGFGVTNDLLLQFLVNLDSLEYVTPSGERVRLPTTGFRESVQSAIDYCRKRVN